MEKVRVDSIPLNNYLVDVVDENVRSDQEVQRYSGQWKSRESVDWLIATACNNGHIPEIILGEYVDKYGMIVKTIIDGLQRTTYLLNFRYHNYRLGKNVKDNLVEYNAKKRNEKGQIERDSDGNIVWETKVFDISKHTFDELPEEIKTIFDKKVMTAVVHEGCTPDKLSDLVCRYNNHTAMNSSQVAFTYMKNFARLVRKITELASFEEMYSFKEKTKGSFERIIIETIMAAKYIDNWNKTPKKLSAWLNENGTESDFTELYDIISEFLECVYDEDDNIYDFITSKFTIKDSFIWYAGLIKANEMNISCEDYIKYLESVDEESSDFIDIFSKRNTKDKKTIVEKLDFIKSGLSSMFNIATKESEENNSCGEAATGGEGEPACVETIGVDEIEVHLYKEETATESTENNELCSNVSPIDTSNWDKNFKEFFDEFKELESVKTVCRSSDDFVVLAVECVTEFSGKKKPTKEVYDAIIGSASDFSEWISENKDFKTLTIKNFPHFIKFVDFVYTEHVVSESIAFKTFLDTLKNADKNEIEIVTFEMLRDSIDKKYLKRAI